jgi:hypothetical protein
MRMFVKSMTIVMDRKIGAHLKEIDPITGRKRVFAFMADKVTECKSAQYDDMWKRKTRLE